MKKKKALVKVMFVFVFLLCVFFLIGGNSVSKKQKKLLERIEIKNWEVEETGEGNILNATVKMPDYETIFLESYEKAEKGLFSNEKKFEKKLYKLAEKKAKKEEQQVEQQITVNLSMLEEKIKIKSDKKAEKFIREYVMEQALEELCVEILNAGFQEMMCGEAAE